MPKKKRKQLKGEPPAAKWEPRPLDLNPETTRDILAFAFVFLGAMLTLSYFGIAGRLGESILEFAKGFTGITAYTAGPGLLFLAYIMIFKKKVGVSARTYLSMAASGVAFSGLAASLVAGSGGQLGRLIVDSLAFLDRPLTFILLLLLTVGFVLLAFNLSVGKLVELAGRRRSGEADPIKIKLPFRGAKQRSIFSPKQEAPVEVAKPISTDNWTPYPLDLLAEETGAPSTGDIVKQSEIIKHTLATFGVEVTMGDIAVGPTVTQFTLKPEEGVKLTQITALANDLSLALAAHPIRVEAPIPGKAYAGIEVPNKTPQLVRLKPLFEHKEYARVRSELAVPLGRSVAGDPFVVDIKVMPHLLIAGATNSGKSVSINAILLALLHKNSPDSLRLILVDPKRVELTPYNDVPHLLTPVITEADKALSALKWATDEMDRRFRAFSETGARNIDEFHLKNKEPFPHILIVVDEMATLMQLASKEVEALITRLAQMARATGIHLLLATQRPDVNVVTGLIKANITSRIAFSVSSQIDSRTILDFAGAEKLLGKGDMLYTSSELSKPKRAQGAFVDEREINAVIKFLKTAGKPEYDEAVISQNVRIAGKPSLIFEQDGDDDLLDEAIELVGRAGKASASLLQRHLRIGYARAARLIDLMEERGIVGPGDGAKPRDVLVEREQRNL